jgi:hypothetical protein
MPLSRGREMIKKLAAQRAVTMAGWVEIGAAGHGNLTPRPFSKGVLRDPHPKGRCAEGRGEFSSQTTNSRRAAGVPR